MTVLHFLPHILSLFIDRFFLGADHEQIPANSAYLYLQYDVAFFLHIMTLFIVHEKICLQVTCICCIFAVQGRHGTVENVSRILEF